MGKKTPRLGRQELGIFQFILANHPVTVREVADHFAGEGKARTTILTVMERLRGKGLLTRKKVSGAFQYSPMVERSELMRSLVGDFVNRVLGGSLSPFMAFMSEVEEISDEELTELKRLVREIDNKRKRRRKERS